MQFTSNYMVIETDLVIILDSYIVNSTWNKSEVLLLVSIADNNR